MPIADLYSYRRRVAEGEAPDVFIYDQLPQQLKIQVVHIWRDAIGPYYVYGDFEGRNAIENNEAWKLIHNTVAREHGVFSLANERRVDERCEQYFLDISSVDKALDLIEATFLYIDKVARDYDYHARRERGIKQSADDAVKELNERFRRAGVGYQFEDGKIFCVDSELIHSEVVRPALRYLSEPGFAGPRDES